VYRIASDLKKSSLAAKRILDLDLSLGEDMIVRLEGQLGPDEQEGGLLVLGEALCSPTY
jgi:hypothetical protein